MKTILLFIAFFCAAGLAGCGKKTAVPQAAPVAVRTAPAEMRTFELRTETQGIIEPVEHAALSALIPARLEEIRVKEGDSVRKGDILFRSDRVMLENRVTLAEEALKMAKERVLSREADLRVAEVSFNKAELDYNRNRTLSGSSAVSVSAFESAELAFKKAKLIIDQAKAALRTSRAEVSFAEATLEIARKRLADAAVCAPYDGIITAKLRNENEFCNAGTPVLRMEQPAAKRIAVTLSGVHYPAVRTGITRVAVQSAGKDAALVPVTVMDRTIDPVTRTFTVKADLPENFPLPSGSLCDVRVIFGRRRSPALPETALLFRKDGRFAVFAARNGKAHERYVTPGITQNGHTELLHFPAGGEKFIISGQYLVNDGSPVREER